MIGEIEACQIAGYPDCKFAGCPECKGILFQQSVFALLIQHMRATSTLPPMTPKPLALNELQVRRQCPSCGNDLETHAYGGAGNSVIDTCSQCGVIWFDQGEFTKLVRAPGKR